MTPADEAVVGPGAPLEKQVSKVVGLIAAGHFFSHFYLLSLPPLFLFIQREFSVSFVALGLAMTAYNLIGGIIQAPVGFLVDRFGARYLLLIGFGLNAAAIGMIGFVDAYWVLIVLAVFAGIGNSVFHPADYSILSGSVPEKKVGRAFGFHTFAGFLGGAVAPITMGAMASIWGWRTALMAASAAGLATLFVMAVNGRVLGWAAPGRGRRREAPRAGDPKRGWSLLVAPAMLVFFGLFCAITFTTGGINAFTISGLIELHESTYAAANAALTGFLFASAFGVLLGGFLADRFGRHDLVATVALVFAAATVVLPALMPMSAFALVAALTLSGLAFGTVQPARDMMVRAITPAGEMGKVFGFLSVGMSIGASIAPLVFGWFLDNRHPDWVFIGAALFMLLTLVTALAGRFVGVRTGLGRR